MNENFRTDFCLAFPWPSEPSDMKCDTESYMNRVEDMIQKLEQWFPRST